MTLRPRLIRAIRWTHDWLWYEPTWFPEVGSGIGLFLWAIGALCTPDYRLADADVVAPCIFLMIGPARIVALFRRTYGPRIFFAAIGAFWWMWLLAACWNRYGVFPMQGAALYAVGGDLFTLGRFSLPEVLLWVERRQSRHAP